jgi:hypothetical protein
MLLFDIVIGTLFATLAAISAFVITYGEYLKHFPDKKRPLIMAAQAALAAFVFFLLASVLLMVVISPF